MSSKNEMRLCGAILALVLIQLVVSVQSVSIDAIKEAAKGVVDKAADAADKTEPAAETGGVRATALHTVANLAMEKGLDAVGKRYPVVALAAPYVQKLSKPAFKKLHEKINTIGQKKPEEETNEAPAEGEQKPTEAPKEADKKPAEAESKEKEAKPEKKEADVKKEVEKPAEEKKEEPKKEEKKAEETGKAEKEAEKPAEDKKEVKKEEGAEKAEKKAEEKSEDEPEVKAEGESKNENKEDKKEVKKTNKKGKKKKQ